MTQKQLLRARGLGRWAEWTDGDRPALYDLVTRTCGTWLAKRGTDHGFAVAVDTVRVDAYQTHVEKRQLPKDRQLCFSTVDFSGVLEVTDTQRLQQALIRGIGPAKAFGCGLLLVRRL